MIQWIICAVALVAATIGAPMNEPQSEISTDHRPNQPQFRPNIDCGRLGNGNYVFGCSSTFYQCANGEAHPQICHRNLVLDPEQNACEIPANVAVCKDDVMQNPSVVRAKDPFNCQGKPSGMYFLNCNGAYAYCDGAGNLGRRTCPQGTALDEARATCDWPENVPACNKNVKHEKRNSGPPTLPRTANEINSQISMDVAAPGYGPILPPRPRDPIQPQHSYGQQLGPPLLPRPQPQDPSQEPTQQSPPQLVQQPYPQQQAPTLPPQSYGQYHLSQQSPPILPQQPQNPYTQSVQQSLPVVPCPQKPLLPIVPQQPIAFEFDCTTRTDGIYASPSGGCVSFFWKCAHGQSFKYTCPQDLFFSIDKVECHRREDVPECNGQQRSPPQGSLEWKPPTTLPSQQSLPLPVDNWCQQNGKSDGYQAEGCSSHYWYCAVGTTQKMFCPSGLFFDAETYQCNHKEFIVACGGQKPTSLPQQSQQSQQSPPSFNCGGKTDGFYYSKACEKVFIQCVSGIAHFRNCPSDLVFNPNNESCDYSNNCSELKSAQKPPQNPIGDHGNFNNYYNQVQTTQTPPQQFPPLFDCSGKSDGFYQQGQCLNSYFQCSNGIVYQYTCPSGLAFNGEICEYKNLCLSSTQPPQQSPPMIPQQQPYGQPQLLPQQSLPHPVDNWCQQNGKSDGYQAEGCSSHYWYCVVGTTQKMFCPSGLFFDVETYQCNHKEFIVACGGQRPTQPPSQSPPMIPQQPQQPYGQYKPPQQSSPLSQPQQPYEQSQMSPQQSSPAPIQDFCQRNNLNNGFHGEGCNNFFFVCTPESTTKISCPVGLWYDVDTQQCDNRQSIVACGGQKPTQPPQQSPPMIPQQPQQPYGQSQMPIQQSSPTPVFDCSEKSNGYFVEGCNSNYFHCNAGFATSLNCPAGTFYSAQTEQCDYKSNVVECGGQAPTQPSVAQSPVLQPQQPIQQSPPQQSVTPVPAWVAQPYQPSQPQQQSQQQQQQQSSKLPTPIESVNTNPCLSLGNGIYGRRCSRFFFVCTNFKTYDFICSNGQAFDIKTSKCTDRNLISTCPEFQQVTTPAPQQSSTVSQVFNPYSERF